MSWDAWEDRDRIISLLRDLISHHHQLEHRIMSWQDSLNSFKGDVDAMMARVNDHLTQLNNQITTLTGQLANADIPADAQATLDEMKATVEAFDVPSTPPVPVPTPVAPDQPPTPTPPDQPPAPTT